MICQRNRIFYYGLWWWFLTHTIECCVWGFILISSQTIVTCWNFNGVCKFRFSVSVTLTVLCTKTVKKNEQVWMSHSFLTRLILRRSCLLASKIDKNRNKKKGFMIMLIAVCCCLIEKGCEFSVSRTVNETCHPNLFTASFQISTYFWVASRIIIIIRLWHPRRVQRKLHLPTLPKLLHLQEPRKGVQHHHGSRKGRWDINA